MAREVFKIEGLKELDEALSDLGSKATKKNTIKRGLIDIGKPIAEEAERNSRVLTGTLQRSFGVSDKLSKRQKSMNKKESSVEVYAGPGALKQAITEEFGTPTQAPHATLRPSWDSNKKPALNNFKDFLWKQIEKTVARAARKAARLAAKM